MKAKPTLKKSLAKKEAVEFLAEEKKYLSQYYKLLFQTPVPIAIFRGNNYIVELANDSALGILVKDKSFIGKPLFEVMPELENPIKEIFDNIMQSGIPFQANEMEVTLFRNSKNETVWFNVNYQPISEDDNTISGILASANEVTEQVLARKKIEESEHRYREMIYSSPSLISICKGENMIIEIANEAMIQSWGKGNIIGKSVFEAVPESIEQGFDKLLLSVYKTGKPVHAFEAPVLLLRNGIKELVYYNFIYQAQRNINGEIVGVATIANEVTPQALLNIHLKESEEHFRLMADLMPSKISNRNATGNVTYFNKKWLDFSGCTFEELKDFGYQKIMHPDEIEEFQQLFQKAAENGTDLVMEMRFKNKNGDYVWHLNTASPIKDKNGELKMWVGVTTEMQQQKEQREKLEHVVENFICMRMAQCAVLEKLEHAVAERTLELSAANAELKIMNKELQAFTYVSSHDLQEPLRKIQTLVSRILEKENQNLSDNGKVYFGFIQNSAERMQTLIQDLLAFSRLSMADRKFETTDLNIIVEEIKNEFKDAIAEKNAVIEVEEICEVKVIPFQFRQLMHNLISNALKFSNPKIPPHIKISSVNINSNKINVANIQPEKEYCHITISDNGIGFEKEYAERIFEVFQKLHSKDEYAGTGIGLAIVKKIVDNHNGIITATSELNKGTRFDIYIPHYL